MSLNSPSALMRTTVVTAMKFTITDQPQQIDALLRSCIGRYNRDRDIERGPVTHSKIR